ncbi:MAG: hypothetical protein HY321_22465 [Armatimonadetes bacterium]|nr:hypothetical protein [Armatimonadota bacterium]
MGSIALVLIMLAVGVAIGRFAGRSLLAQYSLAFLAAVVVSFGFYFVVVH